MAAIFLLLALLHYTFYLCNPTQRADRYFAHYALTYCLGIACVPYSATESAELPSWEWGWAISVVEFGLLVLSRLWAVRALYSLFGFAPSRAYWGLVLSGGLLLLGQWLTLLSPWFLIPFLIFAFLSQAEALRLTVRALRQHRRGARIIAFGYGGGLLVVLFNLALPVLKVSMTELVSNLLLQPGVLLPALSISLLSGQRVCPRRRAAAGEAA